MGSKIDLSGLAKLGNLSSLHHLTHQTRSSTLACVCTLRVREGIHIFILCPSILKSETVSWFSSTVTSSIWWIRFSSCVSTFDFGGDEGHVMTSTCPRHSLVIGYRSDTGRLHIGYTSATSCMNSSTLLYHLLPYQAV